MYARKAWKQLMDIDNDLMDSRMLDKQGAHLGEGEIDVAAVPVVAAVSVVNNDALLDVNKDDD